MERSLTEMLLIIAALAAMLIIISISSTLNPLNLTQRKISGTKQYVSGSIADLIYKCYQNNAGKNKAIICFEVPINSNDAVTPDDIFSLLKIKMNISKVKIDTSDLRGKIIIRYENGNVYVKQMEGIVE